MTRITHKDQTEIASVEVEINAIIDEIVERFPGLHEIRYSLYCDMVDVYVSTGEIPKIDLEQFEENS